MRLLKYMEYSVKNKDINRIRSCKIHLSKSNENIERIKNIMEEHAIDISIIEKIEKENRKLNMFHKGKIFMDFIIDEKPNKITHKIKNKLKLKVLEFNDDLCKIQRNLEEDLRKLEEK